MVEFEEMEVGMVVDVDVEFESESELVGKRGGGRCCDRIVLGRRYPPRENSIRLGGSIGGPGNKSSTRTVWL